MDVCTLCGERRLQLCKGVEEMNVCGVCSWRYGRSIYGGHGGFGWMMDGRMVLMDGDAIRLRDTSARAYVLCCISYIHTVGIKLLLYVWTYMYEPQRTVLETLR